MIGGPSRHFQWDDARVLVQIKALLAQNQNINYTLTTSRRTPPSFLEQLKNQQQLPENIQVVPFNETMPEWIENQLVKSASTWVTEDSVSMVYEALTSQSTVGLLNLEKSKSSRVSRGVETLLSKGMVTRFDTQENYKKNLGMSSPMNPEARRCADWIVDEWLTPLPEYSTDWLPTYGEV